MVLLHLIQLLLLLVAGIVFLCDAFGFRLAGVGFIALGLACLAFYFLISQLGPALTS